jgi:hypothetical protein
VTFLIADTFTDSLARLTGDEQKAAKTTAFDLQMDPSAPGLSFHKLDKAKDKRFWSVRVNADIRLIVHKTDASLLLCYVDHHDRAYAWAERRKLETHPTTGAAQIIELRESVREIVVPTYVQAAAAPKPVTRPLAGQSDDVLLGYGVPAEWLKEVRDADEDDLLALTGYLPAEAAEAMLELATGGTPYVSKAEPTPIGTVPDPFTHPDAQRRFRVVTSVEELERAMDHLGISGLSSSTRSSANLSPEISPGLRAWRVRLALERPWWPCIAPFIWPARCRIAASCSRRSRSRWHMRCAPTSSG